MSKKKKKQIQLRLDAIQTDLIVLFDVVGHLSKPVGCGNCPCNDPIDTSDTVTTGYPNVTWITPETKVAALEEANESLWEQLEGVEQEADEYARQVGKLSVALASQEALIDKFRTVLSRISNHQEDNASEAAWEALR